MTPDHFHKLVERRIKALRDEGETARADRLERALKHADELLGQMEGKA